MEIDGATAALLVAMAALVTKGVGFVKLLLATDWRGIRNQLLAWIGGITAPFIASATDVSQTAQDAGGAAKAFWGVLLGSLASVWYDLRASLDNQDTAKEPSV